MTNVPKHDLERGAYIVYTDEPGEVLSPGSTGGGGVAFYEVEMNADTGAMTLSATYSELLEKMESGAVCYGVLSEEGFVFMQLPIFCLTPGDKYYTYRAVLYKAIPEWEMVVFESETDDANMVYTPN